MYLCTSCLYGISIFAGLKYDEYSFLKILDMMLQGRIAQNNAYLDRMT
jgi:hypothetical protein